MQAITDLRKQTAATAISPLGLMTRHERVWGVEVAGLAREINASREKFDVRYAIVLHDPDPGSSTFLEFTDAYENPYNRGPI